MAVVSEEQSRGNPTDRYPLLMDRLEKREDEHVIDIERSHEAYSSGSSEDDSQHYNNHNEVRPSSSPQLLITHSPSSSSSANSIPRSPSLGRRSEGFGRRWWSPFNTFLWISIELLFTVGQIIAAAVVLSRSTNENLESPLFAWVVGYAAGCAATLPLFYWRCLHRNQSGEQGSSQVRQGSHQGNSPSEPNSYDTISFARSLEEGNNGHNTSSGSQNGLTVGGSNLRLKMLVDHFKMALDCFFAVWFVVGNVWIFGGNSSSAEAPNLYRLCIVFLTISCIGYAMPFILCGMICCCLPCIISIIGLREDMNQPEGASDESINALPTHKYKLKGNGNIERKDSNSSVDGGIVAAGTDKERAILGEDAVCCICLARYTDNDLLSELPCTHFFHTECVNKWLKINASCPLCKFQIGGANVIINRSSEADSNQQYEVSSNQNHRDHSLSLE